MNEKPEGKTMKSAIEERAGIELPKGPMSAEQVGNVLKEVNRRAESGELADPDVEVTTATFDERKQFLLYAISQANDLRPAERALLILKTVHPWKPKGWSGTYNQWIATELREYLGTRAVHEMQIIALERTAMNRVKDAIARLRANGIPLVSG